MLTKDSIRITTGGQGCKTTWNPHKMRKDVYCDPFTILLTSKTTLFCDNVISNAGQWLGPKIQIGTRHWVWFLTYTVVIIQIKRSARSGLNNGFSSTNLSVARLSCTYTITTVCLIESFNFFVFEGILGSPWANTRDDRCQGVNLAKLWTWIWQEITISVQNKHNSQL